MPDNEQHDEVHEETVSMTGNPMIINPPTDMSYNPPLYNERWQDVEIPTGYTLPLGQFLEEHENLHDILERFRARPPVRLQGLDEEFGDIISCMPVRRRLIDISRRNPLTTPESMGYPDRSVYDHAIREILGERPKSLDDQDDPDTEPPASA